MDISENPPAKPSYEELYQENILLRQKLASAQPEDRSVWRLLAESNRRLQLSSAAIKASVSSLLNYDIFWDGTNQHEFLETINSSIDQVGRLVNLLTLIFRLEAGNLNLQREYQPLPEIILTVQDHFSRRANGLILETALPRDGKLVLVSFDYLVMALEFLLDAAGQLGARRVKLEAEEAGDSWLVHLTGLASSSLQQIQELLKNPDALAEPSSGMAPDAQLSLWLAFHLIQPQEIQYDVVDGPDGSPRLQIRVPARASL